MGEQYMHTVYRNAKREETEWDAAQRRLGNLPPLPPDWVPPPWAPAAERALDAGALASASEVRAEEAEDATCDDRVLEDLRHAMRLHLRLRGVIMTTLTLRMYHASDGGGCLSCGQTRRGRASAHCCRCAATPSCGR